MWETAKKVVEKLQGKVEISECGLEWYVGNYLKNATLLNGVEFELIPTVNQEDCWELNVDGEFMFGYFSRNKEDWIKLERDILDLALQERREKVINLTPHDITVRLETGEEKNFPATGKAARVKTLSEPAKKVMGVPTVTQSYDVIEGLPEPKKGVLYLVSMVVRQAAQAEGRTDVISPDTSPEGAIRDDKGRIVAVRRFVR